MSFQNNLFLLTTALALTSVCLSDVAWTPRVRILQLSPTSVILSVTPPPGIPSNYVVGYKVFYTDGINSRSASFSRGDRVELFDLSPGIYYVIRVTAVLSDGQRTKPSDISLTTHIARNPMPVSIKSLPYGDNPYSFTVEWNGPEDVGAPVLKYIIRYRQVAVNSQFEVLRPLSDWINIGAGASQRSLTLWNLMPGSYYEVIIIAENEMGRSMEVPYLFKTADLH